MNFSPSLQTFPKHSEKLKELYSEYPWFHDYHVPIFVSSHVHF